MPVKSTKDTNAPKKPLTAYMLFSADERPKLKASGLDNFAEMNKALGAAWKQADQKTKSHYEKEHEREKIRYDHELKEYQKSGEPAPSSKSAQKTQPPPNSKTTKSSTTTTTTKSTSKKDIPADKNGKHKKNENEKENEDDNEESEEESGEGSGDEEEEGSEEEEEEEEEKPAPPVKSSRKKN